jgi:hypothetical protein
MLFVKQSNDEIILNLESYLSFISPVLSTDMRILIQNRLSNADSEPFKFVFSVFYQANIFSSPRGYDYFLNLIQHEDIKHLSTTLRLILETPLLIELDVEKTQHILCSLINHPDIQIVNQAIMCLDNEPNQLLRGEFATIILKTVLQHNTPQGISSMLMLLNEYDLLSVQNIHIVSQNPRPMTLSRQLRRLFGLGISPHLFQEILLGATEGPSANPFCQKIESLHENNNLSMSSILAIRRNCQVSDIDSSILDHCQLVDDIAKFNVKGLSFFSPSVASSPAQSASTDSLSSADSSDSSSIQRLRELLANCNM